jgi:hypothetical protein
MSSAHITLALPFPLAQLFFDCGKVGDQRIGRLIDHGRSCLSLSRCSGPIDWRHESGLSRHRDSDVLLGGLLCRGAWIDRAAFDAGSEVIIRQAAQGNECRKGARQIRGIGRICEPWIAGKPHQLLSDAGIDFQIIAQERKPLAVVKIGLGLDERLAQANEAFDSLSLPAATLCGPFLARLASSVCNRSGRHHRALPVQGLREAVPGRAQMRSQDRSGDLPAMSVMSGRRNACHPSHTYV